MTMLNYFELMAMPQQFDLNIDQLQSHLRNLQAQYHPDSQFGTATPAGILANLNNEQRSAVINEAYQNLLNPDTRAAHLLALQGINQDITSSIHDLDFLDEAMDYRIALDNAMLKDITELQAKLTSWIAEFESKFEQNYKILMHNQSEQVADDAQKHALDATQKLQFLVKLSRDVTKKQDELAAAESSDNDDDLYV